MNIYTAVVARDGQSPVHIAQTETGACAFASSEEEALEAVKVTYRRSIIGGRFDEGCALHALDPAHVRQVLQYGRVHFMDVGTEN